MNKEKIIDLFVILLGNSILAIAVTVFILEYNILSGGVAGIAVAISPIINIDKNIVINFIVISLFFVGWFVLGKEFALNTVISSIAYPFFLTITDKYIPKIVVDPLIASLYGGLIAGVGIGLVIRTGASTGGMDIPPLILNKVTGIKISTLIVIIDALTVALGLFTFGISAVLVGFISVFASGYTIDKVLMYGGSVSKSVQIISDKYEEIVEEISVKLDRGCTLVKSIGGYTKNEKVMVLVVVSQKQYSELIHIINEIDNKSFVITTDATAVHGEGFNLGFKV